MLRFGGVPLALKMMSMMTPSSAFSDAAMRFSSDSRSFSRLEMRPSSWPFVPLAASFISRSKFTCARRLSASFWVSST
jgi:hypothetical protein